MDKINNENNNPVSGEVLISLMLLTDYLVPQTLISDCRQDSSNKHNSKKINSNKTSTTSI